MHTTLNKSLPLLLTLAALLGLAACDIEGDQRITWEPGDELGISQLPAAQNDVLPFDGFAPGETYFTVEAHNRDWNYTWGVTPDLESEVLQNQEIFRVAYDSAATFAVSVATTIDGEQYDDTVSVEVVLPTTLQQVDRQPQFSTLASLIGAAEDTTELGMALADAGLNADTSDAGEDVALTVLAPTNEAFVAALDTSGNGELEEGEIIGGPALSTVLAYHIIPQKIVASEISDGQTVTTLAGTQLTFNVAADGAITVDGATITQPNVPVSNGVVHGIDALLASSLDDVDVDAGDDGDDDGDGGGADN